jgi:hypothetical protein
MSDVRDLIAEEIARSNMSGFDRMPATGNIEDRRHGLGWLTSKLERAGMPFDARGLLPFDTRYPKTPDWVGAPPSPLGLMLGYDEIANDKRPRGPR